MAKETERERLAREDRQRAARIQMREEAAFRNKLSYVAQQYLEEHKIETDGWYKLLVDPIILLYIGIGLGTILGIEIFGY